MPSFRIFRHGVLGWRQAPGWGVSGGGGVDTAPRCPARTCTDLLGAELLIPDSGAQQGPEGTQELPPRPVLDRQEHGHVLLDAPRGQLTNLQGQETGGRGSILSWRGGRKARGQRVAQGVGERGLHPVGGIRYRNIKGLPFTDSGSRHQASRPRLVFVVTRG